MSAMDDDAANGYLDIDQFLHEIRREGCSTSTMDGAAFSDHLDVIQWLYAHRNEGARLPP